jgi:hypothetical protein
MDEKEARKGGDFLKVKKILNNGRNEGQGR